MAKCFSDLTEYKYHSTVELNFKQGCANYFISTGAFGELKDTCNQSGDMGMTFDDFRNAYGEYELIGDLSEINPAD